MTKRSVYIFALAVCLLFVFAGVAFAGPTSREYPYLYKSPRALGMGGAYIAVGGRTDALFYNPAGLSRMPLKNWEVNLGGITVEWNKNVMDFIGDLGDALDTSDLNRDGDEGDDQLDAVLDVIAKYRGRNMHLTAADLMSIGRRGDKKAFAVAGLGSLRIDALTHQGFGSNGLLEINADATFGGIGGMSYQLRDNLALGAGLKLLHREALIHSFTAREIVEKQDTLDKYITEDLRQSGNAVGVDLGGIYQFARNSRCKPAVGLSLLNVGGLNFDEAGEIPMTVNIGLSASPENIPVFKSLTLGVDYVDLFNGYDQDSDIAKRLRLGGELQLFDRKLAGMAVRTGLYQGYPTFGIDARLLIFTASYVTYAEEVGAYAGQDKDRRHLVMLNMGW